MYMCVPIRRHAKKSYLNVIFDAQPSCCLEYRLLRTYAELTRSRVLQAWLRVAKARDINNPASHTLSSYGYIIMILHFLTYHKRTGNGWCQPSSRRQPTASKPTDSTTNSLLNLQWMDPVWPSHPKGTPRVVVCSSKHCTAPYGR
jgi:hypothetical protein